MLAILTGCQPETRVVEMLVEVEVTRVVERPVEVEVTRVIEKPVEVEVTRVVERPVEVEVTRVVERIVTRAAESPAETTATQPAADEEPAPTATASPELEQVSPPRTNVALLGSVSASNGQESASLAIDDNPDSVWTSRNAAVQWIELTLDKFYLIDRIELLVAQTPAGATTHEVWVSEASGTFTKVHASYDVSTSDGDNLEFPIEPSLVIDRVLVLTTESPSWVAWREVRVFGVPAAQPQVEQSTGIAAQLMTDWPRVRLGGFLEWPVQVTNAGDGSGRLFVVEQVGRIRVFGDGGLLSTPLLDIEERVTCCWEQGLLGVAFPPGFADKRYFYVNYTDAEGDTVIARYRLTSDPNIADPNSAEIILRIDQPRDNHNGGHMAFGPDGYLYIGMGDGGEKTRSQDPGNLLGKMLRIDVESGISPYAIPDDNPFAKTTGYRDEIWALGLRNPWGFAFDRQTGDLYIGDVGEGKFEEINFQQESSEGGENYGWPITEGLHCFGAASCSFTGLTLPVAEYPRSQGCAAVVGGTVYRGSRFLSLQGIYFYADFCSGHIWGLIKIGDTWQSRLLYQSPFRISAIGEDEAGNIYVANYSDGVILALQGELEDSAATATSVANATATPAETPVSLEEKGRLLFVERGCVACHVVSSVPEAVGTSGPALDGFGDSSKWPLIAGVLVNTPDNTKRWLLDPASFKPDTAMLNAGLSDSDADAIVAFLRTLK